MDTLVVIPARISSTRLPGKVLADINGRPLIVRAYECAMLSQVGDVIVACDDSGVKNAIEGIGGTAVLTDPKLPSGTDRVFEAWQKFDSEKKYNYVINVQGDLPFVDAEFIEKAAEIVKGSSCDISTLATPIKDESYKCSSTVKPVISFMGSNSGEALYFSRSAVPYGGPYYNHVGIYCFRAESLIRFVNLPQSPLEKTEKLEQLRALENNMTIGITIIDKESPISIDTYEDLERARAYAQGKAL
ncbi:MAG: 3-deoxy-manno-octulosonate cytidylyltransferase [Alphaproteobacteria bacterium]|nr:3-deoxy-manno-octulosonate cytidylyltransferase [Alphaproteobacteria bacterium]